MPTPVRFIVAAPNLPEAPAGTVEALARWARALTLELSRYFASLSDQAADHRLFGRVDAQVLPAGFTIEPTQVFIDLYADGNVTSDPTNAIKNGSDGQWICLENRSLFNITILDGAGTFLGSNVVLAPNGTLLVRWDDALWVRF